jgi:O-antigen/teichoic acid export membrane protein
MPLLRLGRKQRPREIAANAMTVTLAGGLISQLVLIASGTFAARLLGAEDRGYLALIALVPVGLSQLGTLGLPVATTFYVAQRPRAARATVGQLVPLCISQAVLLVALHAGLLVVISHATNLPWAPAILSLAVIPASLALQYGLAILQGTQAFRRLNGLMILPAALYALGLTVLMVAGSGALFVVTAVWVGTMSVAAAATLLASVRALPAGGEDAPSVTEMTRFGVRALIDTTSPVEIFRVDQALIGLFLSPKALGLYVVALAFTNLPRFISRSIGIVAYPAIAAARAQTRREIWRYVTLVVVITGAAAVVLEALMPRIIPMFFGSQFAEAVPVARLILIASFLVAIRRVLADCFRGAGRPELGTIAEVSSWIVLFPVLAPFAALWGLEGVAFALVAAAATSLVVMLAAPGISAAALRRLRAPTSAVVVGLSCLAGAAVATLSAEAVAYIVFAFAILAVATGILLARSLRTLATILMLLGAGTLAMNGVRVTSWMAVSDAFFLGAALLVIPGALLKPPRPSAIGRSMKPGLLLIVAGGLLSSFVAENWRESNLNFIKFLVASVLVLALVSAWGPSAVDLRHIMLAWIGSATISAAWALKGATAEVDRPAGLAGHPNTLAVTCVLALGPALVLTGEMRSWRRVAGIFTTFVLFGGIVVSGSRAGLLGASVVFLLALVLSGRRSVVGAAIGSAAVAALFLAVAQPRLPAVNAINRLFDEHSPSVMQSDAARRTALDEAVDTISRHPFTGVGFENAKATHNIYLEAWASGGLLTLLGLLTIAWATLTPLRAAARRATQAQYREQIVAMGISLGFAGFLVASLFQNAIWERYIWLMPALVSAAWSALPKSVAQHGSPTAPREGRPLPHSRLGEVGV